MRKLAVICFTAAGALLAETLKGQAGENCEMELYQKSAQGETRLLPVTEPLGEWTGKQFAQKDALLFIGAAGIAVRAIAPYVSDKLKDPAVLVMDERGNFVVPILSGHVGGANELAEEIACAVHAIPVLTTATDVNGIFAVDVFARANRLGIANREGIAAVSAALLSGEAADVLISPYEEGIPTQAVLTPMGAERVLLQLCPKNYALGIGCRRGKRVEELRDAVMPVLKKAGIRKEALFAAASIDAKKEEPGILALAKELGVGFVTYSAQELQNVPGIFHASEFVSRKMGVDNVCERAAIAACGEAGGTLIVPKTAGDGITVALARKNGPLPAANHANTVERG